MQEAIPVRQKGSVIIVTGATKGIGRAIAERLSAEGATVVVTGRDAEAGADVEQAAPGPGRCEFMKADNAQDADIASVVRTTIERHGRIDGLVNNAATLRRETLQTTSAEFLRKVLNINLVGAVEYTRLAVEQMITQDGGAIVNIGSTHAWSGLADLFPYSLSKGALLTLTHHVARNYASHGIRCNWLTVGWVLTPGEEEVWKRAGKPIDSLKEKARQFVPMGRMQTPQEIAAGVAFLLSDEASQITDTELDVTGGLRV